MDFDSLIQRVRRVPVLQSKPQSTEDRRNEIQHGRVRKEFGNKVGTVFLEEGLSVVVLLLYFMLLRLVVQQSMQNLLVSSPSPDFNATRARSHLEHITGIGPRPVGSPANEIVTVNYLLEQINAIKVKSSDAHTVSVDVQRPTGSFSIKFLSSFSSYYDNITNIVVKLEPRSGAKHAVLANCHFDSVANTVGASDDAVSCSVMLEILHSLASSSDFLQHAIIILFNGAEENILQASHGFITQHPWASLIRAFINLEAAGVGGRELVFQTGPENPWLVQAYVHAAKHPFASVVGQEVFQSGIIPSDTDFRIFRDFGNIPGIDLAFIDNGYVYHTKYDTPDRILTNSIQRAGDNILAVLKYLATSDNLADPSDYRHGNMVFFDVLGLLVVAYPARVGLILNSIVVAAVVLYLGKKCLQPNATGVCYLKDLTFAICIFLVSIFSAVVTVLIIAALVSLVGQSLSWYSHFGVAVCLYGTAAVAKLILIHTLAKNLYYNNMNPVHLGELYFDASLALWCIALVCLTQAGICSAYVTAIWVVFPLATKLLVQTELKTKGATLKFFLLYLLGMFMPCVHMMYLLWFALEMFVPIFGRSGTEIPADIVIAVLFAVCGAVLASYFVSFVYILKSTKNVLLVLGSLCMITLILVCCGTFFPYSSDPASPKPKRIFLQHITRSFHDLNGDIVKEDSGIWINGFDYTGMSHITPHIPEINDTIRAPCEKAPFCGFPWYFPVHDFLKKSWYLPTEAVSPQARANFRLLSNEKLPWDSTRLTFEITGPTHMTLYIAPHDGCTLSSWSIGNGKPLSSTDEHFVFYSRGLHGSPWQFWMEIQASDEYSDGIVTVAVAAHHFSDEFQRTSQLDAFMKKFPDWTFPFSWVSMYDLFIF